MPRTAHAARAAAPAIAVLLAFMLSPFDRNARSHPSDPDLGAALTITSDQLAQRPAPPNALRAAARRVTTTEDADLPPRVHTGNWIRMPARTGC
jgi:hypothetical protein